MQIEFAAAVAAALESVAAGGHFPELAGAEGRPQIVTVLPVPTAVNADVCSPVLFQLAHQASGRSPTELAAPVLAALDRDCPWFKFELGGTGHLNGSIAPPLIEKFAAEVSTGGARMLFKPQTLTAGHAATGRPQLFRSEYEVDWQTALNGLTLPRGGLEKSAAESSNPDAAVLLDHLRRGWTLDGAVMLLAVLADPEIDSSVYLRGLSGRENVPWFLDRFFRQSRDYLQAVLPSTPKQGNETSTLDPGLKNCWSALMGVREIIFRSAVSPLSRLPCVPPQPERLVGLMVELARCFYSYYNRPEWRAGFGAIEADRLHAAVGLTAVIRDTVSTLATIVKNACGIQDFTLNR